MLKSGVAPNSVPVVEPRRPSNRRRDTREAILTAAEALLQRRGFKSFSYHHIAVQLGIRNAAVHYHYPSKQDLGLALVRRYRERFEGWAREQEATQCAWERIQNLFRTYVGFLEDDCMCCPCGILGAEFHVLPEPMREEAAALMARHHAWVVETLERGRDQGILKFSGDADDKAVEISAALQGALQVARMTRPSRFHQVLSVLSAGLTGRDGNGKVAALTT